MLVQQYISEFNKQARNIKHLSYTDEIALGNKLKLIKSREEIEQVPILDLENFFSNIYHLLSCSSQMKSELLENCVEILLCFVDSYNPKLRDIVLSDFRIVSVMIGYILEHGNDEDLFIKILTLIRELLAFRSELDEHNLKLIVEVLRDHTVNNQNKEISGLCLQVLANLCLQNNAARHIITRAIKTTELKNKISKHSNGLVSFKFFLLMEDEAQPKDAKYFYTISIQELQKSISDFNLDSIRHSQDILRHMERLGLKLDSKLTRDESFMTRLEALNGDLISSFLDKSNAKNKWRFFDGIFNFYEKLLGIESEIVGTLQKFAENLFVSGFVCKSTCALKFLTTFIKFNGSLETLEIVIEKLVDVFITDNKDFITYEQKYAFLSLLKTLQEKGKLSACHQSIIAKHFDNLIGYYKKIPVAQIDEEEIFHFVYFLMTLSSIAKSEISFYGKLSFVLNLDFLPLLIAKAHLLKNEEILVVLFQLAGIDNFPNKKIASLLARSRTRSDTIATDSLYKSLQRRDVQIKNSMFISREVIEDLDKTIERVNSKLDNDEEPKDSDVVYLYRQKNSYLSDHLNSVTSSLDRTTVENNELNHKISSLGKLSEKQEFTNWCLQLDKERMISETQELTKVYKMLENSVVEFRERINKEEMKRVKVEGMLKIKNDEIERLTTTLAKVDEKLIETKDRLRLAKDENESRINELKESLENEQKMKVKELSDAMTEQRRLSLKLVNAEKENQKLQEVIRHNESELVRKQEKIEGYEKELSDSEQMRSTIMNLMQSKSFKK